MATLEVESVEEPTSREVQTSVDEQDSPDVDTAPPPSCSQTYDAECPASEPSQTLQSKNPESPEGSAVVVQVSTVLF